MRNLPAVLTLEAQTPRGFGSAESFLASGRFGKTPVTRAARADRA